MRVVTNEEIEQLLTMPECIAALEEMYRDYAGGQTLLIPRIDNLSPSTEPGTYYGFKQMGGAWPRRHVQALRINSDIISHPLVDGKPRRIRHPRAGGRWVGLVLLFSSETGALLGILQDGIMQHFRVGAANGLALKYLGREDARTLALIGSGWQAGGQLRGALAVRPFEQVRVYSPRPESRTAFVAEAKSRHPGVDIRVADSVEACVDGADVIMAATSAMVRVLQPEWLKPGVHLSCIKLYEVDQTVLDRCDRIVVHNQAQANKYENVMPGTPNDSAEFASGWWNAPGNHFADYPDLARLVAGGVPGRQGASEITCFINNIGIGLQFAATGALVLEKARTAGLGHELPDDWFAQTMP